MAATSTKVDRARSKREFAKWLSLTDGQRAELDLPLTMSGYSRLVGVPARTLRTWREKVVETAEDADFVLGGAVEAVPEETLSQARSGSVGDMVQMSLQVLVALAEKGDIRAAEALLRTPAAKAFMDATVAEWNQTHEGLTDAELIHRVLSVVDDEALLRECELRGLGAS